MIFRRVKAHIEKENWFAVFIDFIIVVFGVFIGIQVANWNAEQVANSQLDQQLVSFRVELEKNRVHFKEYQQSLIEQMDDVAFIRTAFKNDIKDIDPQTIDYKLLNIQRYKIFSPETYAMDELTQTGGLRSVKNSTILAAIDEWGNELTQVRRGYADGLNQRDNVLNPFMMTSIAYGPLLEQSELIGHKITVSKFRNNLAELAASREFDNQIVYRSGISGSNVFYVERLLKKTDILINLLKAREASL